MATKSKRKDTDAAGRRNKSAVKRKDAVVADQPCKKRRRKSSNKASNCNSNGNSNCNSNSNNTNSNSNSNSKSKNRKNKTSKSEDKWIQYKFLLVCLLPF